MLKFGVVVHENFSNGGEVTPDGREHVRVVDTVSRSRDGREPAQSRRGAGDAREPSVLVTAFRRDLFIYDVVHSGKSSRSPIPHQTTRGADNHWRAGKTESAIISNIRQ